MSGSPPPTTYIIRAATCSYIYRGRNLGTAWCGRPSVTTSGMPLCAAHKASELEDLHRAQNGPDLASY